MFLITLKDQPDGVYSLISEEGEHVIFFFEEEDDADRYLMQLEQHEDHQDLPEMTVVEVDIDIASKVCEDKGYHYTVVTPDDVIVPPDDL
tara:strand:+ start:422 stop:691 length:270 start_codon:yes stop_codon:yes gene_type:complete